jgi:hypothetical protein
MSINRKATMAKRQREMEQKDRVKEREQRRAERKVRQAERVASGVTGAPTDELLPAEPGDGDPDGDPGEGAATEGDTAAADDASNRDDAYSASPSPRKGAGETPSP